MKLLEEQHHATSFQYLYFIHKCFIVLKNHYESSSVLDSSKNQCDQFCLQLCIILSGLIMFSNCNFVEAVEKDCHMAMFLSQTNHQKFGSYIYQYKFTFRV